MKQIHGLFYKEKLITLVLACLINLVFFTLFQQRQIDSQYALNGITYDTQMYINLINGLDAPEPFSTRFLLIILARAIPLDPLNSILVINVFCLTLLSGALITLARIYTRDLISAFIAVLIVSSTFTYSYNFTNPYLTDAPAFAFIVIFLIAVHNSNFVSALTALTVSLLFRETAIVFLPIIFLKFNIRAALLGSFAACLVYMVPKLIIEGDIHNPEIYFFGFAQILKSIVALGWVWLLVFYALVKLKTSYTSFNLIILFISIVGSLYSSLVAEDTTRMFMLMVPASLIFIAQLIDDDLIELKYWLIFATLMLVNSLFLLPTIFHGYMPFGSIEDLIKNNIKWLLIVNFIIVLFTFVAIKKSYLKAHNRTFLS